MSAYYMCFSLSILYIRINPLWNPGHINGSNDAGNGILWCFGQPQHVIKVLVTWIFSLKENEKRLHANDYVAAGTLHLFFLREHTRDECSSQVWSEDGVHFWTWYRKCSCCCCYSCILWFLLVALKLGWLWLQGLHHIKLVSSTLAWTYKLNTIDRSFNIRRPLFP